MNEMYILTLERENPYGETALEKWERKIVGLTPYLNKALEKTEAIIDRTIGNEAKNGNLLTDKEVDVNVTVDKKMVVRLTFEDGAFYTICMNGLKPRV